MEAFDLSAKFPLPLAPAPRAAELLAGRQAELRRSLRPYLDEILGRLGLPAGAVVVGYAGSEDFKPVCISDGGMPAPASADRVILCQFMSMVPDWRQSLDTAMAMLKPGGRIGVLDFHLPRHDPRPIKYFWRAWFGRAGLRLSANHLADLRYRCPEHVFAERHVAVPGLPGLRAPCYWFVGKAPATD